VSDETDVALPDDTTMVCCSVLLCVAVYYCVLQCVEMRRSVLQRVAVCCNESDVTDVASPDDILVCYSVLQCVVVCCSVLQCVAVYCSVLQRVAVRCIVLQCD